METKTSDWRPGPTVCRCCFAEGCYKDISTEYFWMGKREVYSEMLTDTFDVSIAYSKSGGPNSNSRLICEPCISRLRDASDFKRQVLECERTFTQHLDPGRIQIEIEDTLESDKEVKLERIKLEKAQSDDDFDDRHFGDDDDDDLDDQPLTKLASKIPKKESVDILDLLDNAKVAVKRKSTAKVKLAPAKKLKTKKEIVKPSASKPAPKPEKKKKDVPTEKYVDYDQESFDEDFLPDCSEYVPSQQTNVLNSPFSSVIRTISSQDEDETLKPEETLESNHDTTLAGRTVNDCSDAEEVVSDNENSQSLIKKVSSQEDKSETLRPEERLKNNHDTALNAPNDCSHAEEVLGDHVDRIEIINSCTIDIEYIDSDTNESNLQSQPSSLREEKSLTRKRKQNSNEWRCNKNKILKNSGKAYEGCNSRKKYPGKTIGPPCVCKKGCGQKFSPSERQAIFDRFYSFANREHQWLYISRHVLTKAIKRMALDRKSNRMQTFNYFFTLNDENITVCKKFFLNTLQIREQMVYTAMEKAKKADEGLKDKRGVHYNRPNKMKTMTEATIKAHIELFPKVESHYTRNNSNREYLSENLNISKMYRFYIEWFTHQNYPDVVMATKRQYETVFNTQYNYSFFKPKKDQCPSCSIYEQSNDTIKATLEEKQRLHLQRKEKVRLLKKGEIETVDKDKNIVAIFDMQKVLNVPQSEVSTFHYKRKYPCYNFTVFDAVRKIGYCYVWHYQIAKSGSTEIGSALLLFFKTEREKGITNFSLYSDGCYGQNKNRYIFALYVYAAKLLGISITHRFFETGHSQNEGDSMHACIEKHLKNKVLYTPEQIFSIILNAKITGEKYRVKELDQSEVCDLKPLVNDKHWRCAKDGKVIHWDEVMEVNVTDSQVNKLFFKYNFEDAYSELDLNNLQSTSGRRRGRKHTQDAAVHLDNVQLHRAYHHPIPISKALHTDLLSMCKSGAIPRVYHPFYESLSCSEARSENISDEVYED